MKLLLVCIYALFSFNVFSYETQGQLVVEKKSPVKEGEIFRAKLLLWPYGSSDRSFFKTLENTFFLDFFYVIEVHNAQRSENNTDVMVVDMTLALGKYFDHNKLYIWNLRDLNIPIEFKGFSPEENPLKIQKFLTWDQKFVKKAKEWPIVEMVLILVGFAIVLVVLYRFFESKKERKEPFNALNFLEECKGTEGFEKIYNNRFKIRANIDGSHLIQFNRLLEELNTYQFQKEWPEDGIRKTEDLFSSLKEEMRQ